MFKSIEVALELYSAMFEVFGAMLLGMARLTSKSLPIFKGLVKIFTEQERYAHIRTRLNTLRDIYLSFMTEAIHLSKDLIEANQQFPEDFDEVVAFGNECNEMGKTFDSAFERIQKRVSLIAEEEKEGTDKFVEWVKASPNFEALEVADKGPKVIITDVELVEIAGVEYDQDYRANDIKSYLEIGVPIGELAERVESQRVRHVGHVVARMERELSGGKHFTYTFNGVRYVYAK